MSRIVFQHDRAIEFWSEFQALLDRYPETLSGLTDCYSEQDALDDGDQLRIQEYGPFDPESPVIHTGIVLMVSVRNMQGYETMFTTYPPEQSAYMTDGLVANRASMI